MNVPIGILGRVIDAISMDESELRILCGADVLVISDKEHICCESRYMHTDDDLPYYVGAKLIGIDLRDGPTEETQDDYGMDVCRESQFLIVQTDRGAITVVNYNDHNGYYGKFDITAKKVAR